MQNRISSLTGIHNFRDYGHYKTLDGAMIRSGFLFRSGQHSDADTSDLSYVATLNLAHVVDLRGDSERVRHPCRRHEDFIASVITVPGETSGSGNAPHHEAAKGISTAREAHDAMVNLYRHMPFRANLIAIFKRYFETLAANQGPNLVHCLAGKDRTGLAVALLHDMLGVHNDDMMADYMLTNTAGNAAARIAAGAEVVRRDFGPDMTDEAVATLMSVDRAYLTTAFAVIRDTHGSLSAYRDTVLGVTRDQENKIKAAVLV